MHGDTLLQLKFTALPPRPGPGHLWQEEPAAMKHCGFGGHLDASVSHVEGGGQVPSVCACLTCSMHVSSDHLVR